MLLMVTSVGWGFNWPIAKQLITELPPLTMRGGTGFVGALLLGIVAVMAGQGLHVPRKMWGRLVLGAFLSVTCWMGLMGLALVWLPAGETAMIAYTMPVWASLLAWPLLGERPTVLRVAALVMAFSGLSVIFGVNGISITAEKLTGYIISLIGAATFALGTVLAKKLPTSLPPLTSATWQIGLGSLPVLFCGLMFETADFGNVSHLGVWLLGYSVVIQVCLAYACWFAALERLPASVAAIGTMLIPVIGLCASAMMLGEPLGLSQMVALAFTVAGVALATRS